jgi:hypothetical protein
LISFRKSSARDFDDDDAAATIVWDTSLTDRVDGSQRRSFAKARKEVRKAVKAQELV